MNGNDPTMNKLRLNHLIQVAEHFTGEDWKSDQVKIMKICRQFRLLIGTIIICHFIYPVYRSGGVWGDGV